MKTALIRLSAIDGGDGQIELWSDGRAAPPVAWWAGPPIARASIARSALEALLADESALEPLTNRSAELQAIGRRLFQALSAGEVSRIWAELREQHPAEQAPDEGLRTILQIEGGRLGRLPWELLHDGAAHLFLAQGSPLLRGVGRLLDGKPRPLEPPLRVLVVVGARDGAVGQDAEVAGIEQALRSYRHLIECEVLVRPTRQALMAECRIRPDVLHFIGHGRVSASGVASLELDADEGTPGAEPWSWTVEEIGLDLEGRAPALTVVNACRTAGGDPAIASTIVDELIRRVRSDAVIGVQGDIKHDSAGAFSKALYEALVAHRPLDRAVADARNAVRAIRAAGVQFRDWALPVLASRVPPEQALALGPLSMSPSVAAVRAVASFDDVNLFVDRSPQRLDIRAALQGLPPQAPRPANLLVVHGDGEMGKTLVTKWALRVCGLLGQRFVYADLATGATMGVLEVLAAIVEVMRALPQALRPPAAILDRFEAPARRRLGGAPGAPFGELSLARGRDAELVPALCGDFLQMLEGAAADRPTVIAIDHLSKDRGIERGHFVNYLWPLVIRPIAQGAVPGVRVILAATSEERRTWVPALPGDAVSIELGACPARELRRCVRQFCDLVEVAPEVRDRFLEGFVAHTKGGDWPPGMVLGTLRRFGRRA